MPGAASGERAPITYGSPGRIRAIRRAPSSARSTSAPSRPRGSAGSLPAAGGSNGATSPRDDGSLVQGYRRPAGRILGLLSEGACIQRGANRGGDCEHSGATMEARKVKILP